MTKHIPDVSLQASGMVDREEKPAEVHGAWPETIAILEAVRRTAFLEQGAGNWRTGSQLED